jgi:hypothetical protein
LHRRRAPTYNFATHGDRAGRSLPISADEDSLNILNGNYLFNTPTDAPSAYFGVLTAGFAVLLIGGAIIYWRRAKLARNNPIQRRFIRRTSKAAMWIGVVGLFFAFMRYIEFPYLGEPIWLLLVLISAILVVAYFVYDRSERYPVAVWQLQQNTMARRYRPIVKPRPEPQRVRPKERGKRRR